MELEEQDYKVLLALSRYYHHSASLDTIWRATDRKEKRKDLKERLQKLTKMGLLIHHPGGFGGMWRFTDAAREATRDLAISREKACEPNPQ